MKYDKSNRNIKNNCMHLTNYSVNKKNSDYVRYELQGGGLGIADNRECG